MGVEYRYLLIPSDNTHRPDAQAVERLIHAWRDSSFAVKPGSPEHKALNYKQGSTNYAHAAATGASLHTAKGWGSFHDKDIGRTSQGELILQWPVTRTLKRGIRNPLGLVDEEDGTYFDLELHFSDDFVHTCNEMIDPMDAECGKCGKDLEHSPDHKQDIFYAGRIRWACPKCKTEFRPQDHVAVCRDGMTGDESELPGGAVYRFAIVVDCGKCWRTDDSAEEAPAVTEEFLSVCSKALGVPLYGVGYFY